MPELPRVCQFSATTFDSHYFANLGKGLAASGVPLLVGSLREKSPPPWLAAAPGARYFCLSARNRLGYPGAALRLARLLRREHVDVLQTHLFDGGLVGVLAGRLARTPLVVLTRHHLDQTWLIGTRYHVTLDRWMANAANRVVVLSEAVRDHLVAREGVPAERIEVIYQGFDFASLSPEQEERRRVRAELGLGTSFAIGCIASFSKTKGHAYLFAALRDILKEATEARLVLFGGGDRSSVKALVRSLRLQDRVCFAGFRKDVGACIHAMDVIVHPSLSEAFCQVLVETMAVGTPLVTTDVGGAREVITDGETGWLVPPADTGAITQAVLRLYRDPDLRQRVAAEAQRSVRQRFTVERMVRRQLECYRDWLAEPNSVKAKSGSAPRLDAPASGRPSNAWWAVHTARYLFATQHVAGRRTLDIACGTGYGLPILRAGTRRIVGADLDRRALNKAQAEPGQSPWTLVSSDGKRLPFSDGSFDAVTSFETIEHLKERDLFLAELRRVLAPGGILILSTPNANHTEPVNGKPRNPYHVYEYTPEELRATLEGHFEEVTLLGQVLDPRFVLSPFWDDQQRLPRTLRAQARLRLWRLLNKLPADLRDAVSRLVWGHPLLPTERDYRFLLESVAEAPVLVALGHVGRPDRNLARQ